MAMAFIRGVFGGNRQGVLSAEKISTLSSRLNPVVRPDRGVLDKLWRELLVIDEHSWQADRSTTDPESYQAVHQGAVKDARATGAKRMIDYLLGRGFSAIADLIDRPKGTLVVFNPLNWQRSDFVTVEIEKGVSLIDLATNQSVSFELLLTSASYQRIRFVASDVPSLGYKCYALKSADAGVAAAPASNPAPELENSYYRVALDASTGSVRTIFDKELNRELVDASSPYRFNQYLYVTGADKLPNRLVQYSTTSPVPVLNIHASSQGRIVSLMTVPSGTVARLESSGFNTPLIETEIILPAGQKKIQFVNRIEKKKVYSKEGVYFVFPFAMQNPQFRYSIQNGFVDPSKDLLPGAGREWFSVQHWVEVKEREVSAALVPVDAPLITLGDIARGTWPKEFGQRQGTVFSYVMNNYTPEGYLAGQGGEFTFRYTLTSGNDLDLAKLGHLGWEAMSPLEVNEIRPNDKVIQASSRLNSVQTSLLQIDQLNVSLITWKLAENGEGTILRFLELSGGATKVRVTVPIVEVESAWLCNAVEDNQKALPVFSDGFFFEIKPFQIVTVRLKTKEHGS